MARASKGKSKVNLIRKTGRKPKFQADLAPSEDSMVRALKAELELTSNTDFLSDALALFRWAVSERRKGHRIISESAAAEREILLIRRLERVAPNVELLPQVHIHWTAAELESLAKLAARSRAEPPPDLVRALRN